MLLPLFAKLPYLKKTEKLNNQNINIDFNLIRKMPINLNIDSVRWYFHLTGIHANLNEPYIFAEPHKYIKNKIVIMIRPIKKSLALTINFLKIINHQFQRFRRGI